MPRSPDQIVVASASPRMPGFAINPGGGVLAAADDQIWTCVNGLEKPGYGVDWAWQSPRKTLHRGPGRAGPSVSARLCALQGKHGGQDFIPFGYPAGFLGKEPEPIAGFLWSVGFRQLPETCPVRDCRCRLPA